MAPGTGMITKDAKDILVTDDSLFFRVKLRDILTACGHRVRMASDGREAIEEISSGAHPVDLLILDINMPEVDGVEVLRWMNENGHRGTIPVLVVTTKYDEPGSAGELKRLTTLGATAFMSKAFSPQHIVLRANSILFAEKIPGEKVPRRRVPVSIPVHYTTGPTTSTGFLLNLSETGAFLHTKEELTEGMLLKMDFDLPRREGSHTVFGTVKWVSDQTERDSIFLGGGVMFEGITGEVREAIAGFVTEEAERLGIPED